MYANTSEELRRVAAQEDYGRNPIISTYDKNEFSPKGSFVGAVQGGLPGFIFGLASDVTSYFLNKKSSERANKFASEEAEKAFAREYAASLEAREYNSEMNQVERMKKAGLSPALAYGQLSSSAMQPPSSSAASASQQAPASFDGAVEGATQGMRIGIDAQKAESLIDLQSQQSAKTSVERVQVEIDNLTRNKTNIANYEALLASRDLDDATRRRIITLLDTEKEQLGETIRNLRAATSKLGVETEFISGAQTEQAHAASYLAYEQGKTQKSVRDLNEEHVNLSATQRKKIISEINRIDYDLDNDLEARQAVKDKLDEYGIDPRYWRYVSDFLREVAPEVTHDVTKSLSSWISGDNWIPFFGRWLSSKNIGRSNAFEHIIDGDDKKKE